MDEKELLQSCRALVNSLRAYCHRYYLYAAGRREAAGSRFPACANRNGKAYIHFDYWYTYIIRVYVCIKSNGVWMVSVFSIIEFNFSNSHFVVNRIRLFKSSE